MIKFQCEFGDAETEWMNDMVTPTGWTMVSYAVNPPQPPPVQADVALSMREPPPMLPPPIVRTGHVCPKHSADQVLRAVRSSYGPLKT